MKSKKQYKVIVQLNNPNRNTAEKTTYVQFIGKNGKSVWSSKQAAYRHAMAWKSANLLDAWVESV